MGASRPQSNGNAISLANSLEMSATLVRFYQQQKGTTTATIKATAITNNPTAATVLHKNEN